MTTSQNKSDSLMSYLILMLSGLVCSIYGYNTYQNSQTTLQDLQQKTVQAEMLATDIQQLRELPAFAAMSSLSSAELTEIIMNSSSSTQIPRTAISSINPHPLQRLGNSTYQILETDVVAQALSLTQLTQLFYKLQNPTQGLWVRDCTLRIHNSPKTVQPVENIEQWDTSFTLTQMVFSPKLR